VSRYSSGDFLTMTSEEANVTDVICFKDFLDQWKYELTAKEVCGMTPDQGCMTIHCKEYLSDDLNMSFEDFAAEYMPSDVVTELAAECRFDVWLCK
jgi:hypothetical protein